VGTSNEPATVTVAGQPAPSDGTNTFRGSAPTTAGTTTVTVTATDPNGNVATQQYEVDVAGATTTYTFDDNGNLTGDGLKTYVWNARNQLLKVQHGGADLAVFTYDGAGRRVTKTAGGVTRTYIYDGPDILEERVSTGDVIRYVHGPGMDNVLARTTNGANAVYYATDHLGSIVHETNAAGAVTLHREYDAWGELKQGQTASGFAFTGREWDAETGLYFYRARYYEPTSGRFVGEDPAGYVEGPNLFSYVSGRPTGAVDPTGRWVVALPLAEAALAAAATVAKAAAAVVWTAVAVDWFTSSSKNSSDAQDKLATPKQIKDIERVTGEDIHDIKADFGGQNGDIYVKPDGEFVFKPKGGLGPGEKIGVNKKDCQ